MVGEFYINKIIKKAGTHKIEFEDGRKGECVVLASEEMKKGSVSPYWYHFNGRGKLWRGFRSGRSER